MSRRKQTKPQHWQSDSEEELKIGKVKGCKDAAHAIGDPSNCTPPEHSASTTTVIEGSSQDAQPKHSALTPASVVKDTTATTAVSPGLSPSNNVADGDTELVRETASSREGQSDQAESETKASASDVTLASNHSVGGASNSLENGLVKPARKRGRPPSLHLQKSGSRLPSPASSSPRRQSLRLQRSRGPRPMTPEVARDKMSHRTCQYCGVVKPTPAALCRHIRKHTGERPFVCQVCNKRYKAKRSLHLHQLSHHQELFEHDAALDPSSFASAAVSPSTTNLLRETLETRRLARLTESHDPHSELILDVMALDSDSPQEMTAYKNGSLQSKCNLVNGESQTPADIEGNMKTAEGEDAEEEESLEDLSKRSCPYCFKVCPKPSDLKRHLMVHTGERPFRCQVCHKCFKQKGSLLYHQKAAHDLNVELSQGLEERYLRLKTRSAMRSLAALDGLNHCGMDGFAQFSHSSQDGLFAAADCSGESLDADSGGKHFPYHFLTRHHANSVAGSTFLDNHQDFYFQNSKLKNGLLEEEAGQGTKIVDIEILNTKDVKQHRRQRLLVTKETLLMSRLDGVCLSTGREATVFKCCICGKVFVSLAQTHSHISSHFDLAGMTFDCHLCSAVFMCKSELAEHLQVQHSDEMKVKDNNNDSSGFHHNYYFEEEIAREYQRTRKHFVGFDDHNNNNDKLRDNERAAEPHEEDGDDGDLPLFHSPGVVGGSHEDKGELDDHMRAFPSHCCMVCRKGFTSQYLLQRHMLLHFQQAVTHAGFATAVSTNGLHRDLLTDRLEAVLGLGGTEKEGEEEEEEGSGGQVVAKEHEEEKIISRDQTMESDTAKRSQSCRDKCREDLLENEDIRDDVMVVIPSDPDVDNVEMSEFPTVDDDTECPDLASQERETEIRSAPKRSLLPYRTAGPASKSRRKSSLPTRLDHKTRPMATSSCGPPPASPPPSPLSSSARSPLLSAHVHLGASAEAIDLVPDGHPSSTPSPHLSCPSDEDTWLGRERGSGIKEDSLLAKQTKYVKSLHASYSHAGFLGNGFPSPSPLTVDAGLVGPFASPSLPGQQPVSVQVPTAASTSLLGISSPPSTQTLTNRADEEEQAENLSLSSGNRISPSSPPLSSSHSPASALPSSDEQEGLVGYPRVLWLPSAGSKSNHGSPSPPNLSLTHPSNSSASGKRMQPVWHTLSSDDLRNAPNTDGRKVTSLSRTHSRLYVVNQPVDRERLCKPTILPDGRTVFRCIFCRKDFLSYSDINRHMDFHEDIRPYKCNFCDYYARTNSQLKVHMMRHQGIREFCCKLCNYKGVTQSDLNRHMKSQIHLLKSRNECCRCGEGFVTAKNLEKHVTSICTGKHKMDVEYEAMSRELT